MSYNYAAPPASPSHGFFPAGTTSPNAFAGLQQCPKDAHSLYSIFSSQPPSGSSSPRTSPTLKHRSSSAMLKKLVTRKSS